MLCTFCGTENRPDHKFCGMCGVRLERRQAERRVQPNGVSMKCASCNHVNEPGLKFCGMCGARVERRLQDRRISGDEPRAAAVANAHLPSPEASSDSAAAVATLPERPAPKRTADVPAPPRRTEPAIFRNETTKKIDNGASIGGPSFLGLGSQQQSNDVEYLLEDEPTGGGLRKLVLLVIIAAIIGLVFVQWRSSLKANPKPAPTKIDPAAAPATAPQGDNPASSSANTPPADDANKTAANADPSAVSANESKDTKTEDAKTDTKAEDSKTDAPKADSSAPATDTGTAATDAPADKTSANSKSTPGADVKPTEDARLADYKPSPALLRAQQYLRGRGVQQSCEQGLLYLHAATDKNDPGAAIQMAALYSSGVCVKQDRVMAYRWFNSAHELQPGNMYIQKNMDQLWAQMTSQERRLAGY
jgi:Double zinc ribbon